MRATIEKALVQVDAGWVALSGGQLAGGNMKTATCVWDIWEKINL